MTLRIHRNTETGETAWRERASKSWVLDENAATPPDLPRPIRKQEFLYTCSACGAERGCDCSAPAVEKLKVKKEQDRQRAKAYRERQASRDADIENIEEFRAQARKAKTAKQRALAKAREAALFDEEGEEIKPKTPKQIICDCAYEAQLDGIAARNSLNKVDAADIPPVTREHARLAAELWREIDERLNGARANDDRETSAA